MLNVTQIFSLIETLSQTTLAKIKLEGQNAERKKWRERKSYKLYVITSVSGV